MSDEAWSDSGTTLDVAREALKQFNAERDWGPFHTPRDLAMCVTIESGELLEQFLWKSPDEPLDSAAIEDEIADVMISCVNLATRLDIDLMSAIQGKIAKNGERYPVELARGTARKHDQLTQP